MVRDARMSALVDQENEPIHRVRDARPRLWQAHGVSTVLVMGGSGDTWIWPIRDLRCGPSSPQSGRGRAASARGRIPPGGSRGRAPFALPAPRRRAGSSTPSRGGAEVKIAVHGRELSSGWSGIDLRGLEQLVDESQGAAIGRPRSLELARRRFIDGKAGVPEILDAVDTLLDDGGASTCLDPLTARGPRHPGDHARPRTPTRSPRR